MKYLIVRLSSLGDLIHSLPLVYLIKKLDKNAQVDWLTGKGGYELITLVKEINNIYLPTLKDISSIQKQNYDYVIDVQGLFKSALLSKIAFGKKTIGFKNTREFADIFYDLKVEAGNLFKTTNHIVDLNLKLIPGFNNNAVGKIKFLIPEIKLPLDYWLSKLIEEHARLKKLSRVVIFPSTTWESKLWNIDYWVELFQNLSKEFKIYLCASKSDAQYTEKLLLGLKSSKVAFEDLSGRTSIKDLVFLIQHSSLVVGMDSFGLHLASAVKNDFGYPEVVGIYGPTSPLRSGPYNSSQNCLYLSDMECIACRKKKCPLVHHNCMKNILPEHVYSQAKKLSINMINS